MGKDKRSQSPLQFERKSFIVKEKKRRKKNPLTPAFVSFLAWKLVTQCQQGGDFRIHNALEST